MNTSVLFSLICAFCFFDMACPASSIGVSIPKIKHDAEVGYDFLKWSLGPHKTDLKKNLLETSTFLKLAIASAKTDFNEGIIHEDYPPLTLAALEQAVIEDAMEEKKCYELTKSHGNTPPPFVNLSIILPGAVKQTPLGKRGLSNTTGECAMDSGLQFFRMQLLSLAIISVENDTVSFPDYPSLNKAISYLPYLKKFLLNQITTDEESRELRLEMAQFVDWRLLERPWTPASNLSYGETGCALGFGMLPTGVIGAWSYLLYLPAAFEVETASAAKISPQTQEKYKYTACFRQLTIPFLGVDVTTPTSMGEVIQKNLEQRGRKMIGSLPPTIAYSLEAADSGFAAPPNPNLNGLPFPNYEHKLYDSDLIVGKLFASISQKILDPIEISLFDKNNLSSVVTTSTLIPSTINMAIFSCSEGTFSGHVYSLIREQGSWYEINNESVFPIPKDWEKDIPLFIGRYPIELNISYTTLDALNQPLLEENHIETPSFEKALALHAKMLMLCLIDPRITDYFLNDTFFWWAFYKEHPKLLEELQELKSEK